ncbi:leukocyte elastase inhibitor [Nematostella vectensis]|uniref:leukocyte elastase inhibitor n=1 Tax=Nematostella vectensis TaxID=45351 RepID=UPI002077037E|nr:leukocyte elastase inhibitor [Nematostella vectensis]
MAQSPAGLSTNAFALDLHRVLTAQGGQTNLFYSPASIVVALAMTYLGARGNTATQMTKTFHFPTDVPEKFHDFLQALNASNSDGNQILMANRLFAQMGFEILEEFKKASKESFSAEMALVDYVKNSNGARDTVNRWVEQKTKDKIKNLIPEGMFNKDTILCLVNAVYFKGSWMKHFNRNATQSGKFKTTPSQEIQVQFLYQSSEFRYLESSTLGCQIVELPYAGEKLSMVVLLPNEVDGLGKLESSLNKETLQEVMTSLRNSHPEEVEVTLPKFTLTQEFSLGETLKGMGASDLFSPGKADLSGISAAPLVVSEVVHKAFVEVNEEGTIAAAATGVWIMLMSMPMNPVFYANHPFLFLIRHNDTGAVLFMGRLVVPDKDN